MSGALFSHQSACFWMSLLFVILRMVYGTREKVDTRPIVSAPDTMRR